MESVSKILWDLFVFSSVTTGWFFSKINKFNRSLLFAWMVCICDFVYNMDVLAWSSKHTRRLSNVLRNVSLLTVLHFCTVVPLILVSCIPYHALVVLELDISGQVYLLLCALRVGRLLIRVRVYLPSLISFLCKKLREARERKPKKTLGHRGCKETDGGTSHSNLINLRKLRNNQYRTFVHQRHKRIFWSLETFLVQFNSLLT